MQGTLVKFDDTNGPHVLKPGEYGKWKGVWYARPPGDGDYLANLAGHNVSEHANGTITVQPSILVSLGMDVNSPRWHGFLERGEWREA